MNIGLKDLFQDIKVRGAKHGVAVSVNGIKFVPSSVTLGQLVLKVQKSGWGEGEGGRGGGRVGGREEEKNT
jgi:hypothetical protein